MRTGVVLPTFRDRPDAAVELAQRAEEIGVDGVFCYDHLWPMGQPERPALAPFPLLAMIATRTSSVHLGPLVARVGLVPDHVLVDEFEALGSVAPGRVVAAIGTGDRMSAAENDAYDVPYAPADERRAALARCARALRRRGFAVWIGGGARRTVAVAEREGVAVNLWGVAPEVVALQARRSEVTWAGTVADLASRRPGGGEPASAGVPSDPRVDPEAAADLVTELTRAGATWAVFGWPAPLEAIVAAARRAGPRR